ncbi:MAG: patatin-like phospholipase family protein [Acidobacteriia bacterium]|nr:patatin-like phospholipase family protein [Terriglobia bacterium]
MFRLHDLQSRRVGLALSGGSVRGIAHIGVIKALEEAGIPPQVVSGTSAGSLIGAGLAAGMSWRDLARMAHEVFWPSLLHGRTLERFCSRQFPSDFEGLALPFAAVATIMPSRRPLTLKSGKLASAISASCAIRSRRRVAREGHMLKDGGLACVLPSAACRELGADFIIASDVWALSAFLRGVGLTHTHSRMQRAWPRQYLHAVREADLLVQPQIPLGVYLPAKVSVERLIAAGEAATLRALSSLSRQPAA